MSATSAALVLYNDTDGATKLPYACKLDVALRIEGSTTSRDTGKVRKNARGSVFFWRVVHTCCVLCCTGSLSVKS
jgi:hypothetical protein